MGCLGSVLALVVMLVLVVPGARAQEPFVGVDLGVSEPTNANYRAHVQTGGTFNPYAGYMFTKNLGLQGQFHITVQDVDNDQRGFASENQTTSLLGATVGPRVSF